MHGGKWRRVRLAVSACVALGLLAAGQGIGLGADSPSLNRPDLTGVIKDHEGKPLGEASVFIYTAGPEEGVGILCPSCYADCRKRTRADSEGRFKIESLDPTLLFRVLVVANGHRPEFVSKVDPALKPLEVTLKPGRAEVSPSQQVKGRVLDPEGKPVAGAVVSIRGVSRGQSTRFGGNEDIDQVAVTDDDGGFFLANLPPNRDYFVCAKMSSLADKGAVAARRVRLNDDGSVLDVGDVSLSRGFKLEGQIRLTDGKPLPAKTRVLLSRDDAWDSAQTEANEQGRFSFPGVPGETVSLSARIQGYRLSSRNKSLDTMNPFHLVGLLQADKSDLILEFEPGENRPGSRGAYMDIRQEPLLGAEAVGERTGDIHVTGKVLDAETSKPLNNFTVTEGRSEGMPNTFQWFTTRQTEGTNGSLDLFLNNGRGAPAIMVEAEGYVPQSSGAITGTETNLTFALKKGSGPTGIVLKPDGQPASGVTVYLADMRNGVYVQDNEMKVQERIYQGTRSTKTDEKGSFTFKARVEDYAVLILEDEGFAQVTVKELNLKPEVRLQPWAKVQGKLMVGSRPGADE